MRLYIRGIAHTEFNDESVVRLNKKTGGSYPLKILRKLVSAPRKSSAIGKLDYIPSSNIIKKLIIQRNQPLHLLVYTIIDENMHQPT